VIHIKRFRFNNISREKLSTDVHFPLTGLDLKPFISGDIQPVLQLLTKPIQNMTNNNQRDEEIDHSNNNNVLLLSPNISEKHTAAPSEPAPSSTPSSRAPVNLTYYSQTAPLYDLIGVSNHHGSLNGGHYIAHVDTSYAASKGQASRWMCFNDSRVSQANANSISGPTAYVLFYKLRDDSVI
jgi:uncharacterized UBP type Zn finger protein